MYIVQANLPETSPFLFAQMALVSTFFQMLIVLGMYNFDCHLEHDQNKARNIFICKTELQL